MNIIFKSEFLNQNGDIPSRFGMPKR